METIEINYRGVELTIEYETYETDYGVDSSPSWDECEINSVTINSVTAGNAEYKTELIEMLDASQVDEIAEKVLEALND